MQVSYNSYSISSSSSVTSCSTAFCPFLQLKPRQPHISVHVILSLHVLRHGGPADFNMVSFFLSFFLSVHAYRLISQKLLVGLRSNFAFLLGFRSEKNY